MNIALFLESLSEDEKKELSCYFRSHNKNRLTTQKFILDLSAEYIPPQLLYRIKSTLQIIEKELPFLDMITEVEFRKFRNSGRKSWNVLAPIIKKHLDEAHTI